MSEIASTTRTFDLIDRRSYYVEDQVETWREKRNIFGLIDEVFLSDPSARCSQSWKFDLGSPNSSQSYRESRVRRAWKLDIDRRA